ncbi:MAG: hypothetical protein H6767_03595 [Candidatus Peribacteria bacterium]|nr:MAG: hypothetical protein H6767_03595 [Candidatus Peribacteria bacterium]
MERKAYKRKTPKRSAESVIPDIDTDALQITVNIDEITSILSEKKKKREQ